MSITRFAMAPTTAGKSVPKWLQYVSLAFAGCASFAFAVYLSSAGDDEDKIELSERRHMVSTSPNREATSTNTAPKSVNTDTSPRFATPDADHTSGMDEDESLARLSPSVLQSPFDALNLSASVDAPAPLPALANQKPAKKNPEPSLPMGPEIIQAAPAPIAPALPFSVIGSIQGARIGDGKRMAFLNQNGTMIVVHAADIIGGLYQVENITDKSIEFTYLPLKQKQILSVPN